MLITFLGTNGWYDSKTGNTLCTLIDTADYYVILDAGYGLPKADQYMKEDKPVHIFLSHLHLDHIAGLHTLAKFRFGKGLRIYLPEGMKKDLEGIMRHPFTVPLEELEYKARAYELKEGVHNIPYEAQALILPHATKCMGYRIRIDNRVIAYCTDTGYSGNAIRLAKNADALIAECSLLPGEKTPGWPHLNPKEAAAIAKESGAKRLFLTHFDASKYASGEERKKAGLEASKVFEPTVCASDGLSVLI